MNLIFVSRIVQIVVSLAVVALILIQSKGKGLTSSVGGNIGFYKSRRGLERVVFGLTIFLLIVFIANSIYLVIFN